MPSYEYFCPQCSRELGVFRLIDVANGCQDCPDCGGEISRRTSRFGSNTGSHLQPSVGQFSSEFGLGVLKVQQQLPRR